MRLDKRASWLAVFALVGVLLVGAGVRLFRLGYQTMTHPELVAVPGIDLPAELVESHLPWLTFWDAVIGPIRAESHPPLYYVMMLGWTKTFGTDIVAVRLPSVFFGVGCILLAYVLAAGEGEVAAGLTAAAMLALNGHHLFWSQTAKGYILACFLGLLSTVLLLRVARGIARPLLAILLYGAATLAGVATEVFYWPIFLSQMLWVLINSSKRPSVSPLFRWQLLILVLATPFCAIVAHQSRLSSHAVGEPWRFLGEFLEFGFLFEPDIVLPTGPVAMAASIVLPVLAIVLVGTGLAARRTQAVHDHALSGPPTWLSLASAATASAAILLLAGFSYRLGGTRTAAILATAVLPVAIPCFDSLLLRCWPASRVRLLAPGWPGQVTWCHCLGCSPSCPSR